MRRIRSKQKLCGLILLAIFCISMNGCKGQQLPDGMPKPYPTTITIIQDGKPLDNAAISLVPTAMGAWNAAGVTNASGKAQLKTLAKYDGVVPGKYYILVKKLEPHGSDEGINIPDRETDPGGYAKFLQESAKSTHGGYDLVDPKFAKITPDSEIIEVVEGKNEKTIDVGKAVRIQRVIPASWRATG